VKTGSKSSDPLLKHIDFCLFEIECKKQKEEVHLNRKIFAREDISCLARLENCDGYLIARENDSAGRCADRN
jgi:hypothetical protein